MGEEEAKKVEVEGSSEPETPPRSVLSEPANDMTEVMSMTPEEKVDGWKALTVVENAILARVQTEKRLSLIKAWEDSEKVKAENKAVKRMSSILSWENSKMAAIEAELKQMEEALERKKAECAEKMKNRIAIVHKEAEEKRAIVEAKRSEEILKAEEMAAKYKATGASPKKLLGIF
ncbi:hypothetical protein HPP92_022559 [Vanilla planifolia]|uniref:Remorin C-terminal domain-containing protein n=1 Tax=Vanilla planifolia TaxID=51239 RepID=A0A835UDB3_VANPL|nr:hypothetical protein HPP92_022559 [Vanilla planifolia]